MSVKSYKTLILTAALFFIAAVSVSAQYKPLYYSDMPKVSTPFDTVLQKTWEGIKKRNVDAYTTGLVHRPKSNQPNDAVSEGVAYGMFLALYCNDPEYFNKIWDAGEKYMWNSTGTYGNSGNYYDWRVNRSGTKTGTGPASDADQDIALLLIFADRLVKNNVPGWTAYTSVKGATYAARARDIIQTVRTSMVDQGKYLLPGHWGTTPDVKNPGYFAPAFYRVFAEFDPENKSAWMALVGGSYDLIEKSPGYGKGLIPDWCTMSGASTGGAGYNAYFDGDALYRDAIRVYWRLATDYLWYGEERAKIFLDKAVAFLENSHNGAEGANFFDMSGKLHSLDSVEVLGDGVSVDITRTRREHSHLTVGMWAAAAMASRGKEFAEKYSDELLKFYKPGTDFWGYVTDPTGGTEDTLHNEMYFDQFLAWFGASILGGTFTNVWLDLKSGVPAGPLAWKTRPPVLLPDWNIDASVAPLRLGASFNRSTMWTVTLTHESAGQTRTFSGASDTVSVVWYGLNEAGAYMPQGYYTLTINAGNLEYKTEVWLGRPFSSVNLMQGNRLLIDDFNDGDLTPYIGSEWKNFLDSDYGKTGQSTASFSVNKDSKDSSRLHWTYLLNRGHLDYDAHAGIDWACNFDLRGIDTLIFVARVASGTQGVSVQLVSSDFNFPGEWQYFSDSVTLNTTEQVYRLPISKFKQRGDGNDRNINTTLSTMTAIRFQVQDADGSTGTIILERMYLTGTSAALSRLYTPPPPAPEYISPSRDPISVKYRADRGAVKYAIKRAGSGIRVTLPANMAGANARIIDIRGRTVKQMNVPQGGSFDVSVRNLAAGMYFMEIKKQGKAALRVQLGNVR
jgi:endo-1,4-beta-D-glucanase Y